MRRDIIFLVHGIPDGLLIHDAHYFSAPVSEDVTKEIEKIGPDALHLVRRAKGKLFAFGFRNDFEDEGDAIMDAHGKISGIVDGYSFIGQDATPEVWPIIQLREGDQPDASIKFLEFKARVRLNSKDGIAEKKWEERNTKLLSQFLDFFDIVGTDDPKFDTELCNQISLSAKMFRCGSGAQAHGVDFLCKFTALEGLVCGPVEHGHGKLLKERLSLLFRHRNGISDEVAKLWRKRCEASHQGKAFSDSFATLIDPVERLVLGTIVFAVNHVKRARTIEELWTLHAAKYDLPAEATMERPPEITRFATTGLIADPKLKLKNVGLLADHIFRVRGALS